MKRLQFPARRFLLATALALLAAELTTPAFADDLVGRFGFRPGYFLCVRDSGGVIETMLKCVRDEQKYQDERLKSNYQALMKTKSPHDQSIEDDVEEDWQRDRETFCSSPEGTDHTAMLQREICFLDKTTDKASEHRMMLKVYLKKRNEGKHNF